MGGYFGHGGGSGVRIFGVESSTCSAKAPAGGTKLRRGQGGGSGVTISCAMLGCNDSDEGIENVWVSLAEGGMSGPPLAYSVTGRTPLLAANSEKTMTCLPLVISLAGIVSNSTAIKVTSFCGFSSFDHFCVAKK